MNTLSAAHESRPLLKPGQSDPAQSRLRPSRYDASVVTFQANGRDNAPNRHSTTKRGAPPSPGIAPPIFYDRDVCPVRHVLSGLTGKWPLLIVTHLSFGTHRYSGLKGAVPDISDRMLSKTLQGLADDGLVERTEHRTMPPHVDYALTARGHDYCRAIEPLMHWALRHRGAIAQTRSGREP